MRLTVVNVMQQIGAAFGASFAPYIPELCPYLLNIVQSDRTKDRAVTCAVSWFTFISVVNAGFDC